VSIGFNANELTKFMEQTHFETFFDGGINLKRADGTFERRADGTKVKRLLPKYRKEYVHVLETEPEKHLLTILRGAKGFLAFEAALLGRESDFGMLPEFVGEWIRAFGGAVAKHRDEPPFNIILPHLSEFAVTLTSDWGLFAGSAARTLFDRVLGERMPLVDGKPKKNTTFKEHYRAFQVELIVTGTNLETGKTQVFSCSDTPDVSVADAVRISIGIPFAFKPVVISNDDHSPKPDIKGVWVDGGLLNNLPFREFDD
jgi:hypothetical protein